MNPLPLQHDLLCLDHCSTDPPRTPSDSPAMDVSPNDRMPVQSTSHGYNREDKIVLILLRMRLRAARNDDDLPGLDPMREDGMDFRACRDSVLDELFELSGEYLASKRRKPA